MILSEERTLHERINILCTLLDIVELNKRIGHRS